MKSESANNANDLSYMGSDPGAVKHGNFINYYKFHNVDQRINNLHPEMLPKINSNEIYCLDIGCNTGELTKSLVVYLKTNYPNTNINILGIDIDPTLIQRANETNNVPGISYMTSNIMNETDRLDIHKYLETHGKQKFDIIFCFSVTMWIHLNNGDDGLLEFLRYIKSLTKVIIIEPQPWNCYRNAQRRVKKSGSYFEHYENLTIRGDVDKTIENILGEKPHTKVYESLYSSWNRKIKSFMMAL
ncbi:probable RNA methyltransferase CG11342 [Manduca sexta]|uniref:RNA methyltransferase n=1 Tax=Manduca sexta TaxID=7130 RepID=A0A922CRU1_MANSE|nr:probable RNA methyltransferase CG11342 [Manduca sexta]KAG6455826.1 hypothetical protein O3G_MSEX009394 [Manduca sexta]